MATTAMPKQPKSKKNQKPAKQTHAPATDAQSANLDPAIQKIIDNARALPTGAAPKKGAFILSTVSGILLWASFTPLNLGPLAWLALVPLLLLVRIERPTSAMYRITYCIGFVWSVATLQWMRLGHPTMYMALLALSAYIAMYFPAFLGITRAAVHRVKVPMVIAVPVVWVGLEFVRAHLLTGFSWYYLGHSQWMWPELIQISDITGAYGVSFLVAMVAATITMLVPSSIFSKLNLLPTDEKNTASFVTTVRPWLMTVCSLLVFAAVLGYGFARRSQADFQPGPQVALVQGNVTSAVKHDPDSFMETLRTHDQLTGHAVLQQPDLIVWPESMFQFPMQICDPSMTDEQLIAALKGHPDLATHREALLTRWRSNEVKLRLAEDSKKANAAMMIGLMTQVADEDGLRAYNSAAFLRPDSGYEDRYDKLHRVIFGEYIPLKETLPFLQMFSPYGSRSGLEAGESSKVFTWQNWNLVPIICFEDTVPHLVRSIADKSALQGKPVDCFINMTNDGWFHGSSQLNQHLITASFRCVETRTPMVRAVNTGISAFIDGDGVIRDPEYFYDFDNKTKSTMTDESGAWRKSLNAVVVSNVPLDNRSSLYVKFGDWFGIGCCFLAFFAALLGFVKRPKANIATAAA